MGRLDPSASKRKCFGSICLCKANDATVRAGRVADSTVPVGIQMEFFWLRIPVYATDRLMSRANPIYPIDPIGLPGRICSVCHSTWSGYRDTYIPLPIGFRDKRLTNPSPVEDGAWLGLEKDVRLALNLPPDHELRPGDNLGTPKYYIKPNTSDLLFYIGPPFVSNRVAELLVNTGVTGVKPKRIEARWHPSVKDKSKSPPDLFGLLVTGRGWRKGVDLRTITDCSHCERRIFPRPEIMLIDQDRWDGSDVFTIDLNPNIVIVTAHVRDLLNRYDFTNYRLTPVESTAD